jgi:flavin reductase (DIM6/NTAB) family NADH-FMN oxidoreductase RutF
MFLVTAVHPASGARAGCLVGFATQCSISPGRFLVAISRSNATHAVALAAEVLAVHGPARDQHGLAVLFGAETGDEIDKFARGSRGPSGCRC